jgi:hypothetical protein
MSTDLEQFKASRFPFSEEHTCVTKRTERYVMDAVQGKPRPMNTAPGMIYILCGDTQRSNTDPSDKTSPAIPIGPHWMITWPFDHSS